MLRLQKTPRFAETELPKADARDLAGTWCGCLCIPRGQLCVGTRLFCTRKKALDEDRYEESGLGCALGLPIPICGTRTRRYVNGLPTNGFDSTNCCGAPDFHWYRDPGCAGGSAVPPFFAKKVG